MKSTPSAVFKLLQAEYDTQVPERQSAIVLPFMREWSKVVEILSARGVVIALQEFGVCAAFSRGKLFSYMLEEQSLIWNDWL